MSLADLLPPSASHFWRGLVCALDSEGGVVGLENLVSCQGGDSRPRLLSKLRPPCDDGFPTMGSRHGRDQPRQEPPCRNPVSARTPHWEGDRAGKGREGQGRAQQPGWLGWELGTRQGPRAEHGYRVKLTLLPCSPPGQAPHSIVCHSCKQLPARWVGDGGKAGLGAGHHLLMTRLQMSWRTH